MKRTPLRSMSRKRRRQLPERAAVRAQVLERDGGCRAAALMPDIDCAGRLDVHEVVTRARDPHAWLDPSKCLTVCRAHHDYLTAHPADAERLGLMSRWFPMWQLCSIDTCINRVGAHTMAELDERLVEAGWRKERHLFDTERQWYCPTHSADGAA